MKGYQILRDQRGQEMLLLKEKSGKKRANRRRASTAGPRNEKKRNL